MLRNQYASVLRSVCTANSSRRYGQPDVIAGSKEIILCHPGVIDSR